MDDQGIYTMPIQKVEDVIEHAQRLSRESDAPTDIHPIFRRENFLKAQHCQAASLNTTSDHYKALIVDEAVYQRMSDALRLATIFLRLSKPFFCKVLFGEWRLDPLDDTYTLMPFDSIPPIWTSLAEALLTILCQKVIFFTKPDPSLEGFGRWAMMTIAMRPQGRAHIPFGRDYLGFFSQRNLSHVPIRAKRAVDFCFAQSLVHELCHVVGTSRPFPNIEKADGFSPVGRTEPKFSSTDKMRELGNSWGQWAFGAEGYLTWPVKISMMNEKLFAVIWVRVRPHEPPPKVAKLRSCTALGNSSRLARSHKAVLSGPMNSKQQPRATKSAMRRRRRGHSVSRDFPVVHRVSPSNFPRGYRYTFSGQDDVYTNDLAGWKQVCEAFEAGEVSIEVTDGAHAQFQRAYAAVHGDDSLAAFYVPDRECAKEAPF